MRDAIGSVAEAEIISLEGLGTPAQPHPIQQAFIDEQATQCGFCLSGVILTAKAFSIRTRGPLTTRSNWRSPRAVPLLCERSYGESHPPLRAGVGGVRH